MYDFNQVHVLGRLTRDPEMRVTQSGMNIASFTIANNKGKDPDKVSFFDCVAFDKTADFASAYLVKGKPILITGSISQNRWQDKESGQNRSKVEIVVSDIKFLPNSEQKQQDNHGNSDNQEPPF